MVLAAGRAKANKKGVSDKFHLKTTDLLWGEGRCKELHLSCLHA